MKRSLTNVGASVRARLGALAREKGINFELLLVRHVHERLLYRLGQSKYRQRFILKGAMLQTIWLADPFRPTRDLDLLGHGDSDPDSLRLIFREILAIECNDGVIFDLEGLSVEPIREETEYGGQRIETTARIAGAQLRIRIDLGFGDAVTPDADEIAYPVLLDQPAPRVRAYPKETVVAEKVQAIVVLGATNGRMKDFYDLWMMSRHFSFEAALLANAIAATFERRRTPLPAGIPVGLSDEFATDADAGAAMGVLHESQCSERATRFLGGSGRSIAWLSDAGHPIGRQIKHRFGLVAAGWALAPVAVRALRPSPCLE